MVAEPRITEAQLELVTSDIPGAEGPVIDRLGRLFLVCPPRGQVLRVEPRGCVIHATTGGIPAGLAIDRQNCLWVADMQRGVLRISEDGKQIDALINEYDGHPMRGCNDLAFDSQGNLYVTAPAGSSAAQPVGEVYFRSNSGSVSRLDDGFAFSNGIAVDAVGYTLIVAETMTRKLWRYDLKQPGVIASKQLFATMPGEHRVGADGMDFDSAGNLLVANWGEKSIDVFDPTGALLERMTVSGHASNLHFGGPDRRTLFITEHSTNALWRTSWKTPGQREWGLG